MRLRKVKDRGQSTKLKRLQWSLVKVKDRGGHNFESCVSPWCLCQSNYSIVQTCDKFSLSTLRSWALIEPALRSTWENHAYPLCIWFAREFFSVFTAWVPYVDGKMSLKHGSLFLICSFSSPVSVIHSLYSLAMGMRIARLPSENRREHFILKKKKQVKKISITQ